MTLLKYALTKPLPQPPARQRGPAGLEAALAPLVEEQRAMSDRIGKLNHTIEVCLYQQKERDSHTNLNRDLVLLVILVVMIQVLFLLTCFSLRPF